MTACKWRPLLLALCLAWACSKPSPSQKTDPHLKKGYDLLEREPAAALQAFEQVGEAQRSKALYGIGLANEALRRFDRAEAALSQAKLASPGDVAPRTALARVLLFQGRAADARREVATAAVDHPSDLLAVLLEAVTASNPPEQRTALDRLRAWPAARKPGIDKAEAERLPGEYLAVRSELEAAVGDPKLASTLGKQAAAAPTLSTHGTLLLAEFADRFHNERLALAMLQRVAGAKAPEALIPGAVELAFRRGNLPLAKVLIDELPVHPPNPTGLFLTGRHALLVGNAKAAATALSEALRLMPEGESENRNRARLLLAEALLLDGQPQRAVPVLEDVLKSEPNQPSAELFMSRAESKLGKTEKAIERLERVTSQHPKEAKLVEELGLLHLVNGNPEAAERQFRRLRELAPKSTRPVRLLGQALARQGRMADVTTVFEAAADANPTDIEMLRILVGHHLKQKQGDRAVETLARRAAAAPTMDVISRLLAATFEQLGRKAEQLETLEALTARSPRSAEGWTDLARAYSSGGNSAKAIEALARVVEFDPRSPEARIRLAAEHAKAGHAAEAAREYEAASKLAENDVVALNNAAVLYADELNQPERAVELAEKAHALAPDNGSVMDTLGWALTRRGLEKDADRAIDLLRRAVVMTNSPVVKGHLESAEQRFGRAATSRPATGDGDAVDPETRRLLDELAAPGSDAPKAD